MKHYPGLWDRLLCLLPFEPAFFARHNLPATFVGHPVLESGADTGDAARFRARHGVAPDRALLTVMPGSRRTEVSRLLPVLGATLQRVAGGPNPAGGADRRPVAEAVRAGTAAWPVAPILVTETGEKHDAFAASAAALTKSGTSTLELALAGVPMLVGYRVNPLTAFIARRTVKVRYASLLNLLAGAGDRARDDPAGLHAGPARRGADTSADRPGRRRRAARCLPGRAGQAAAAARPALGSRRRCGAGTAGRVAGQVEWGAQGQIQRLMPVDIATAALGGDRTFRAGHNERRFSGRCPDRFFVISGPTYRSEGDVN